MKDLKDIWENTYKGKEDWFPETIETVNRLYDDIFKELKSSKEANILLEQTKKKVDNELKLYPDGTTLEAKVYNLIHGLEYYIEKDKLLAYNYVENAMSEKGIEPKHNWSESVKFRKAQVMLKRQLDNEHKLRH